MKRLISFLVVLVALFLSGSVFSKGFIFECDGKKYEAAPKDLYAYYTWEGAKAACEGFVDPDDFNKDWFLPSKDQLNAMYVQLKEKGLGDFEPYESYFSSTELNYDEYELKVENGVWYQTFDNGIPIVGDKKDERLFLRVRCIRAL